MKLLITGSSGFLGPYVLNKLSTYGECHRLSRGRGDYACDLRHWDGGLDLSQLKKNKYDAFVHIAGLYNLAAQPVEFYQQNVLATHHALSIAQKLDIPIFVNVSSIAASVNLKLKKILPTDLKIDDNYPDEYAKTKAQAEQLVKSWSYPFQSIVNIRPGVLVGDSQTGKINRVDGPYWAAYALNKIKEKLKYIPGPIPLPGRPGVHIPIVPVDVAGQAMAKLILNSLEKKATGRLDYHITPRRGLSLSTLYEDTLTQINLNKDFSLTDILPKQLMLKASEKLAHLPHAETEYLYRFTQYDLESTNLVLGENWCPEYEDFKNSFWSGYEKFISHS